MSRKLEVADDEMTRVLRGMTGAERLRIASRMFSSARRMIASHLAAEHPDWDPERIERMTSIRILMGDQIDRACLEEWGAWLDPKNVWQEVLSRLDSNPES